MKPDSPFSPEQIAAVHAALPPAFAHEHHPNDYERSLVRKFLEPNFPDRDALAVQAATARLSGSD